ncbi:MAG: hypothetical protein KBT11_04120 [Treponema sp.]|nr:hypothetical protein [Candidatus Treponema equifaecale]
MKKLYKTTLAVLLLSGMILGSASAQAGKMENRKPDSEKIEKTAKMHKNFRGMKGGFNCGPMMAEQNVVIGKVKKVDVKNGKLVLQNADGKDVEVSVSPFTKIFVETTDQEFNRLPRGKRDEKKPVEPKQKKLSDINNGSWVLVSTFKSETKTLNAAAVFAKVKEINTANNIDAK